MVKAAIEAHEESKNTELGESRSGRRVAKKGWAMGERVVVNMHAMRQSFVGVVRDAKSTAEEQSEEREQGGVVEELSDRQLVDRLVRDRPILLIPASWWSEHKPEFESEGWWQKPTRRIQCEQCRKCKETKELSK